MKEHNHTGPIDALSWTFSRVAMWAPAFIVAIIFYEVIMRYVFFSPTLWVNEMSLWVGGMIYVTAGLYSMQQRSHIRIFILYDIAPLWLRRVFDILSTFCVSVFAFAVIAGGYKEAASRFSRWELFGTVFDPPIPAINKPLILITLLLLALQAISNLIRDWPAAPIVRKTFDILATVLLVGLMAMLVPVLLDTSEGGSALPTVWRVGLGLGMAFSTLVLIRSLICDFNTTPTPVVESSDPADDVELPPEVLTGNPPKADNTPRNTLNK